MNPTDIPAYMAHVGVAARAAATAMAAASTAAKEPGAARPGARGCVRDSRRRCGRPTRWTWTPHAPPAWPRRCSTG